MADPPSIQALALVKRKAASSALIPPPPHTKRQKRPPKQLTEEEYTEAVQTIIERDFYPSLADMRKQTAYFDALAEGNPVRIAEAGRNLTSNAEDEEQEEGPVAEEDRVEQNKAREMKEDVRGMTLDTFQAKYTSEDNESFNSLIDAQNAANQERYAWKYNNNRKLSKQQLQIEQKKVLLIEQGKDPTVAGERPDDDGEERWGRGLDMWKWAPNNVLMNPPPGLEDQLDPSAGLKVIRHENTRVPGPPQKSTGETPAPSPSISTIEDAIGGRRHDTPKVNGYSFVSTPKPTDLGAPQMTWGTLSSVPPSPFRVPEIPARAKIARKLAEKAEKDMTARQRSFTPVARLSTLRKGTLGRGVPKFASSPDVRKLGLTPAGQRLWEGSLQGKQGILGGDGGRESAAQVSSSVVGRTPLMRTPKLKEGATPMVKK